MPVRIGGRVDDIFQNQTEMDAAGEGAMAHADGADQRVVRLQTEVTEVSEIMRGDFESMAADLDGIIDATRRHLESSDWDGASRENADAAEAAFRTDINSALTAAMTGVENLNRAMLAQVTSFHEEVSGTFKTIMGNIQENYATLGRGAANFASYLEEGDSQAIQFTG